MSCCPQIQLPFSNVSSSTITYTATMQQQFGNTPRVFVYYYDPVNGEFYLSNAFFTRVGYAGGTINIDHGGPQRGYIVIR